MNQVIKKILSLVIAGALLAGSIPAAIADDVDASVQISSLTLKQNKGFENGKASLNLTQLARYDSGMNNADGGVMEIIDYNAKTGWAYAVNGQAGVLSAIPLSNLTDTGSIKLLDGNDIDVKALVNDEGFTYGDMTSVAVSPDGTRLAAAIQAEDYKENGRAALFICNADGTLTFEKAIETGVQPDMITFTPDGTKIFTANEGEPREGYTAPAVDPEGSVTVIDASTGTAVTAGFDAFSHDTLTASGVVLKKGATPSADLEPEYIAADNSKAYVTLQEANAVAVLDIESKAFTGVYPLGTIDYESVKIDLNKGDAAYVPDNYADVLGLRMPDAISTYTVGDKTYIITANEGDSREWGAEPNVYTNEASKKLTSASGVETGKKVTYLDSTDYDGLAADKTYLFGSRSFTVFEVTDSGLTPIFDSGNDFESKTAKYLPDYFNCSNDSIDVDDRSNKKGPEPESVTVGTVDGKTYAFVTLERIGGIMVYDITDPANVKYTNYMNSRDFSAEIGADDSPEGIKFVPAEKSPTNEALLLAACEVGGTVAVYELTKNLSADGKISIYFTNDVHCAYEKYDQVATAVKDKDILIDAGDNIQGDLIGTLSDGGYMVDILNYIGYDAAVPGNHEFDYGMDRFLEIAKGSEDKEKLADYDYISCNLREIATNTPLLDSYKIYEAEGKKVAVVGITTPETLVKSNPSYFKNENGDWIYDFANDLTGEALYTAVQNAVNAAKADGADYIIAVGHLGTDDESKPWTSTEVIANTTDIDVLIDGHSHSTFNTKVKNKNNEDVITLQTGTNLANIGKVAIDESGTITPELIPITETAPEADAATTAFLKDITAQFEGIKNQKVAETEVDLVINDPESGSRIIRNSETNLGDLCADAYREKLGADIAFVNGGGIRANIKKGDITFGDIVAVHPYGNEVCMIEVTGQQILDALEWASRTNPGENGGFLQVSGLTYEIHNYIPSPCTADAQGGFDSISDGERRVKNVKVGGVDIDVSKKYKLGGHNYMLFDYGDGFNMFKNSTTLLESVAIDNQVLIDYITDTLDGKVLENSKYANPYGEGRILKVENSTEITGCTYNSETNKLTPTFKINSVDADEETIIIAIYANGALASVITENTSLNTVGEDTADIDISAVPAGAYTYKVMVWNSLSGQVPKANVYQGSVTISE